MIIFGPSGALALALGAICSCATNADSNEGLTVPFISKPSEFLNDISAKAAFDRNGAEIDQNSIGQVKSMEAAATLAASKKLAAVGVIDVELPKDCYVDMECFNQAQYLKLIQKYGRDLIRHTDEVDSYFSNHILDIVHLDTAVGQASSTADKTIAMVSRDQKLRELYGSSLNDAQLEEQTPEVRDLAIFWIRSQIRLRDIQASTWLFETAAQDDSNDKVSLLQDAWLIIQHADRSPHLQYYGVQKLKDSKFPATHGNQWAMLVDRLQLSLGKPQVYATQLRCVEGSYLITPTIDDATVEERRQELGLGKLEVEIGTSLGKC